MNLWIFRLADFRMRRSPVFIQIHSYSYGKDTLHQQRSRRSELRPRVYLDPQQVLIVPAYM